jgi:hypothetical protein
MHRMGEGGFFAAIFCFCHLLSFILFGAACLLAGIVLASTVLVLGGVEC